MNFLLFWMLGWFITWIDDFLIFSFIYNSTISKYEKILAILWLICSVIWIILITLLSWQILHDVLRPYVFVGSFVPLGLGYKILYDYYISYKIKKEKILQGFLPEDLQEDSLSFSF